MASVDIRISTDLIEPSLRDDYWREVTRPFVETLRSTTANAPPLEGTMLIRTVGSMTLGSTKFNAQRYVRDKRTIAQGGLDDYLIHVLAAGSIHGDFAGKDVVAAPGGICVIDLARTYTCEVDAGVRMATTVPRASIEKLLGARDLHGFVLKAGQPLTRLLVDYIQGLHAISASLSASEDIAVQDALMTLLAAGLASAPPAHAEPKSVLGRALRERLLAFIESHLTHPDLGPELLIQRFRISRAHLYRAFADDGGIVGVIRNKRLSAAYRALLDPSRAARPTAGIATDFGFSDGGKFRKAFVASFGVTPDDVREQGQYMTLPAAGAGHLSTHFAAFGGQPAARQTRS
ncbi:Transcriptional activator FeaR [Pandoraea iniqua]|uniref:AraC-like ligand-binding domain-containing protein n=1 Tax=Pandoraea iniqua TaxID=2508288 RepID=UPI0012428209|nr:helix-turn-helix domain-containing protein [Pandoraea iniqua]VVD81106.1 Transcriptional activator FeaR [Pandoraea iniqua]